MKMNATNEVNFIKVFAIYDMALDEHIHLFVASSYVAAQRSFITMISNIEEYIAKEYTLRCIGKFNVIDAALVSHTHETVTTGIKELGLPEPKVKKPAAKKGAKNV